MFPLDKQTARSIKSVYISNEIKKPERLYQVTTASHWGVPFGVLGSVVSDAININAAESTQKIVDKNQIDIKKIVYNRWANQIPAKTKFKLANKPTDTILTTEIALYGIATPGGFSTEYQPTLVIDAKLVRNNKIIWQDRGSVQSIIMSDLPKYKMDEITADPKKLYAMWDKASEKVINEMLENISR